MKLNQIVRKILEKVPQTRDDHISLIIYVHCFQGMGSCTENDLRTFKDTTNITMLRDLQRKGSLSMESDIERCSRKAQKEDVLLRGKLWEQRQKQAKKQAIEKSRRDTE